MGNTQSSQELTGSSQQRQDRSSFFYSGRSRKNSAAEHGPRSTGRGARSPGPDFTESSSLPSISDDILAQAVGSTIHASRTPSLTHSQGEVFSGASKPAFSSISHNNKTERNSTLPQPDIFPSSLPETRFVNPRGTAAQFKKGMSTPSLDDEEGHPTLITWNSPANTVYVTGTFNGWKHKIPLNKSVNEFSTVVNFPPGIHHLKFIVDDEWKCSNELLTATDHDGNLVNYIEVDSISLPIYDSNSDLFSTSPSGEYSSKIPEFNLSANSCRGSTASNSADSASKNKPPALPPHLEKVILNAAPLNDDGPGLTSEDSWLLPVPNHVVLNHLYACSIRDGVMAVAGTTRYRNKYVTTIYYKPVVI